MAALLAVAALLVAGAFGVSQLTRDEAGSMLAEADTALIQADTVTADTPSDVGPEAAAQVLSEENNPASLGDNLPSKTETTPKPPSEEVQTAAEPTAVVSEAGPPATARTPKVLVIVFGDGAGARQAETTLQRTLSRATGLDAIDPRGLEMARADRGAVQAALAGDFSALARLGHEFGAEYLLVGDLSATAVPSVGNFYTGSAALDVNVYRASTGGLVNGEAFRVGSGSIPGKLGQNELDARSQAVDEVSQSAARAANNWVRQLR